MSFHLEIKCSKDIEKLSINFADGTSSVTEVQKPKSEPKAKKVPPKAKPVVDVGENSGSSDVALDLDTDFTVSKEIVQKPNVKRDRGVKVAEDMQNAEF